MKNIILTAFAIISFLMAGCNGNANGTINSSSDTSADTIGKHSPNGIDTLNRKRLDSVVNKNDSLH
jgi:PBP1b-binding outer membrane lipoprotein LpoB